MSKILIKKLLKESLSNNVWYHGTPDVRELEKNNGFTDRFINVEYISNIEKFDELQNLLRDFRENGKEDEYFKALNEVGKLKEKFRMDKPIFLTNKFNVAKTYADPRRSIDYQNAVEGVLKINVSEGSGVKINATGDRFRFIDISKVKRGFLSAGINENDFDKVLRMFTFHTNPSKGIKTDNIAAIGKWFNFDYIDVMGVLDSYNGGSVKSTVKMVLNKKIIKIVK